MFFIGIKIMNDILIYFIVQVFEEEEGAIKQTIEILDSDKAFSTFNNALVQTGGSSFLQMDSRSPHKAALEVQRVAEKLNAPALVEMASRAHQVQSTC